MSKVMMSLFAGAGVALSVLLGGRVLADDAAATPAASEIPEAEIPFWDNAQAFVDAYTARDTEAIGRLFTEDVEFFDEYGERTIGREAVQDLFASVFENSPEAMIEEIQLDQVRFITDRVALEEGVTVSADSPSAVPASSRYVALHVKGEDGTWRINTLKSYGRDVADRAANLGQMIWMVGDWVSEQSEAVVKTSCRWSEDGNYLLKDFTVQVDGETALSGTQRIGWDPLRRQIRSWTFDSDGGFFQGVWTRNGNQWLVSVHGVTSDGEPSSGTAVHTIVDGEMVTWQYRNLVIGREVREDTEPVVMVRRAPSPAEADTK